MKIYGLKSLVKNASKDAVGVREMVQGLKALIALLEDLGSSPIIDTTTYNICKCSSRASDASSGTTHMWCRYTCRQNTHI